MEKLNELYKNLYYCYRRVHYLDFYKLNEEDKENLCKNEKQMFNDHLNSEHLDAEKVVAQRLNMLEKKIEEISNLNKL